MTSVAVDLVVLTVRDDHLEVLLRRRASSPYRGRWALPGGTVEPDEDLPASAARHLAEKTGVSSPSVHLEQLATYGHPRRDPRGRVVSVGYLAFGPQLPDPRTGGAQWVPVDDALADPRRLAFDHHSILGDGVERARSKLEYTPLATAFCPAEFTVAELRLVYEAVWGHPLDPRNFHRKITGTPGFVEPAGSSTTRAGGRPAQLYRRGTASLLHPAMLRARATEPEPSESGG
jgi:8-oxo-dGTP diphosphatase